MSRGVLGHGADHLEDEVLLVAVAAPPTQHVSASSGDSYSVRDKIPRILRRDFSPGFKSDLAYKDLSLALTMAGELRMPLPVTAAAREGPGRRRGGPCRHLQRHAIFKVQPS